jgi:1-acyl-sn-glycerol-3-phosphate acyltransferase
VGLYLYGMRRLISIWIWISTALVALLWLPWLTVVYVFTAPRDPGRYVVGRWFRRAAVTAVALNPLWKFRTSGVRIRDPRRPYVAVANHESFADIFLISHLPWEMKWLSKEAIFKIPVMGWMMKMAGDVEVRRGERTSRAQALDDCRDRLLKKVSVMIMPEGTRSPTGELLPFKDGAFRLAVELGCPILPIAVAGTRGAMPKGSLLFSRARAEARVLAPVETAGLSAADVPALRERVREMIGEAREALFRELAGDVPPVLAHT